jgi:hypothetical protein
MVCIAAALLASSNTASIKIIDAFTIRPNVPYIKVSSRANSSIGGTDGTSR